MQSTLVIALWLATLPWIPSLEEAHERSSAVEENLSAMQRQIDYFHHLFEIGYAPCHWKEQQGWKLQAEVERAHSRLEKEGVPSLKTFQRVLRDLFNSCRDYHVAIFFYSTESSSLPFQIKGSQGRYFLSYIDPELNRQQPAYLELGDELLAIDSHPVAELVEQIKKEELIESQPLTDEALACDLLTQRQAMLGHRVAQGRVAVKLKKRNGEERVVELDWDYHPEQIYHRQELTTQCFAAKEKGMSEGNPRKICRELFGKQMMLPMYEAQQANRKPSACLEEKGTSLGGRKSYVPLLGSPLWQSQEDCPFWAYLFLLPNGKTAGYIRLAHYQGGASQLKQFGEIIQFFEQESDLLVIDQVDNPGGSPFYLYALCGMLTDRPLEPLRHRAILTHREAMMAASVIPALEKINEDAQAKALLGEYFDGYPVTVQLAHRFLNYLQFTLEEWQAGKRLTSLYYLFGLEKIEPHPKYRYTKPLLILTNRLGFSAADFFAAIMHDSGRGLLLGERTAGAGGLFAKLEHLNGFGIRSYHLTSSLAERSNGELIEGKGVEPDVLYEIQPSDLKDGYQKYKQKILSTATQWEKGQLLRREAD